MMNVYRDIIAQEKKLTQQSLSLLPLPRDIRVLRALQDNLRQNWRLMPSSSLESHEFRIILLPLLEPLPLYVPFRLCEGSPAAHVHMDGLCRLPRDTQHTAMYLNSYLLFSSVLSTSKGRVVFSAFEYLYRWAGGKNAHVLSELLPASWQDI